MSQPCLSGCGEPPLHHWWIWVRDLLNHPPEPSLVLSLVILSSSHTTKWHTSSKSSSDPSSSRRPLLPTPSLGVRSSRGYVQRWDKGSEGNLEYTQQPQHWPASAWSSMNHKLVPLIFFSYLISQGLVNRIRNVWPNHCKTLSEVLKIILSFYEDYHVEKFLF